MSDAEATARVVWLDSGETRSDAARALDEWARARGVRLVAPTDVAGVTLASAELAQQVESELEKANEAIGAADAEKAEGALARAEELLRRHPEIVQAAWLRAELERTWSSRFLRVQSRDEARARAAWENAEALDGGRVPGIGESTFTVRPRVPTTVIVSGGGRHVSLRVDGLPVEPSGHDARGTIFRFEAAPAEHHVVVMAGTTPALAAWVATTGPEPPPAELVVDDTILCRRDQFRDVRREADRILAPGVACPSWVAAFSNEKPGVVTVARCESDRCGQLLEWRVEAYARKTPGPAEPRPARSGWPAWATWTLVGVGAAAVASTIVIASGALEPRPVETRFVVGGARSE